MLFNETLFYYTRTCGSRFFFALSLIYLLPASLVAAAEHYSLLSSRRGKENGTRERKWDGGNIQSITSVPFPPHFLFHAPEVHAMSPLEMNMRQELQTAAVTVEGDRIRFIGGYHFGIDHIHAYQEESSLFKTYWHPLDAVQLIPPTVMTAPTQPLHDALRAFNAAFETNYSF